MIATSPIPKLDLVAAIEQFIDERDKLWHQLSYDACTTRARLAGLAALNQSLREMLELKPGPLTPVLDPLRAKVELQRCQVCEVFIFQLDHELLGRATAHGLRHALRAAAQFLRAYGFTVTPRHVQQEA